MNTYLKIPAQHTPASDCYVIQGDVCACVLTEGCRVIQTVDTLQSLAFTHANITLYSTLVSAQMCVRVCATCVCVYCKCRGVGC